MSSQIEVLNPATGLAIGTVDNASIADCLHAVDLAHDAFVPWKNPQKLKSGLQAWSRKYPLCFEHMFTGGFS